MNESLNLEDQLGFTIFNSEKKIIGSTRYMDIQPKNLSLEIGWTWINSQYWGSGLNRQCKDLLLDYAFNVLHYNRVQLKTDIRNLRSQKAIEKLGAVKEGVLRSNMLLPDGHRRDSVYYSILKEEWHSTISKSRCKAWRSET